MPILGIFPSEFVFFGTILSDPQAKGMADYQVITACFDLRKKQQTSQQLYES